MSDRPSGIAIPRVERVAVDGVPVFVVDGPSPARCALMFRVGRVDESLPQAGITHLVEHLALFGIGDVDHPYNGCVEGLRTVFAAEGTEQECLDFLRSVTRSLGELSSSRVAREREVLAAEAAGRHTGLFEELVSYRFGPRGFGLVAYPEHGLRWLDPTTVNWWQAQAFQAGNAAVWISGVDPARVVLELERGTRLPSPPVEPIENDLPAWLPSTTAGVGFSLVAPRSAALSASLRIAQKRLFRRLRTEMAVVYHVHVGAQLLDADTVHVAVVCDPLGDNALEARLALEAELHTLAELGPSDEEMELDWRGFERAAMRLDAYAVGFADSLAFDELLGVDAGGVEERVADARGVSRHDVAAAIGAALPTTLWAVPADAAPKNTRAVVAWSPTVLDGRTLVRLGSGTKPDPADHLIVSDDGVCRITPHGAVTVEFDECAASLAWDDGTRTLYGDDGFVLHVRPWEWRDGSAVTRLIDERLPSDLRVPMGPGTGPPPTTQAPVNRTLRRVIFGVITTLCLLVAAIVLFSAPLVDSAQLPFVGVEVPLDAEGNTDCGGASLLVAFNRVHSPATGETQRMVDEACRKTAREDTGLMLALAAGPGVFLLVRWIRDRKRSQALLA